MKNGKISLKKERNLEEFWRFSCDNLSIFFRAENRDLQEGRQQMARELKQVYKENEKLQTQIEKQR